MKQIIFTTILIFAFCFAVFAQKDSLLQRNLFSIKFDEFVEFDIYGKLPINEEKARLDNLFMTVAKDESLRSFIVFRLNKMNQERIK